MKKYEFTGETKAWNVCDLHRIRAVVDIASIGVSAGDLGGWIKSEDNLSHAGDAWVCDDAKVCGDARVCGNAEVSGDATVSEQALVAGNAKVSGTACVYGAALVCEDAQVFGRAWVCDSAKVCGDAKVFGRAWVRGAATLRDGENETIRSYICIGPIGSRSDFTTLNLTSGTVCTGCFNGTLDEFEAAVKAKHGDNAYARLIDYFRTFEVKQEGGEE